MVEAASSFERTGDLEEFQGFFPSDADVRRRFSAARNGHLPLPITIPPTTPPEVVVVDADMVTGEDAPDDDSAVVTALVVHNSLLEAVEWEEGDDKCSCDGGKGCSCGGLPVLIVVSNLLDLDLESEDGEKEEENDDRTPPPVAKQ